jgi:hypothetical protein
MAVIAQSNKAMITFTKLSKNNKSGLHRGKHRAIKSKASRLAVPIYQPSPQMFQPLAQDALDSAQPPSGYPIYSNSMLC